MLNIYKILKPKNKIEIDKEFYKLSDSRKFLYFLKLNLKNINESELLGIIKKFIIKYPNIIDHYCIKLYYNQTLETYIKLSVLNKHYEHMKFYFIYNNDNDIIINEANDF